MPRKIHYSEERRKAGDRKRGIGMEIYSCMGEGWDWEYTGVRMGKEISARRRIGVRGKEEARESVIPI